MGRFVFAAAFAVAGCGFIDNDVTQVTLTMPPQDFNIDTEEWGLEPGPTVPTATDVPIALTNDVDLATEAPSYQQVADLPAVEVTLSSVGFLIVENSLNVDTPPLSIYFGPTAITAPSDVGAELVGTIPSIAAGETGLRPLEFSSNGRGTIKRFMDDYRTPFRVLVYTAVMLEAGQESPTGRLVGQITATATAGLSL